MTESKRALGSPLRRGGGWLEERAFGLWALLPSRVDAGFGGGNKSIATVGIHKEQRRLKKEGNQLQLIDSSASVPLITNTGRYDECLSSVPVPSTFCRIAACLLLLLLRPALAPQTDRRQGRIPKRDWTLWELGSTDLSPHTQYPVPPGPPEAYPTRSTIYDLSDREKEILSTLHTLCFQISSLFFSLLPQLLSS
jgi:hypothetical protein